MVAVGGYELGVPALCALAFAAVLLLAFVSDLMRARVQWRGKLVVITGGSSGIGLAAAKILASKGAHLALLARRKPILDSA
jgi:NADPH:quinone reductase-like Zn-dependent oxidoreductase